MIRPMRWWDVPAAVNIEQDLFDHSPWTAEMFWAELAAIPDSRDVAVLDIAGEVAGYASAQFIGRDGDVNTIAIAKRAQGQGHGRMLMQWLMQTFAEHHCDQVFLEVEATNESAKKLYDSCGFRAIDTRRDYYGVGVDAVVMKWQANNV